MLAGSATNLLYAALVFCLGGLALLAYFGYLVKRRINDILAKADSPRKIGMMRGLTTSLLGITFISLSVAGFALCAMFWGYRTLTREVPIAELTCHAVPDRPGRMILRIAERRGDGYGEPAVFEIEGDRWYVGGDAVEWQRFLNLLGFVSSYKIHSVGGIWRDRGRSSTGFNLNGGPDEFTEQMMRGEGRFPYSLVVREVNGVDVNRVPSEPGADEHFELAITTTKFSLKRRDGPPAWAGGD